jgi:hypothetical protein
MFLNLQDICDRNHVDNAIFVHRRMPQELLFDMWSSSGHVGLCIPEHQILHRSVCNPFQFNVFKTSIQKLDCILTCPSFCIN